MLSAFVLWLRHPRTANRDEMWTARHAELLSRAWNRLVSAARRLSGYEVELVGRELSVDPTRPLWYWPGTPDPADSFALVHLL